MSEQTPFPHRRTYKPLDVPKERFTALRILSALAVVLTVLVVAVGAAAVLVWAAGVLR